MKYQARHWNTNELIHETHSRGELQEDMEFMFPEIKDWQMVQILSCRGCENDSDEDYVIERHDHYGISTGHWCDKCYSSHKYPYRKDAYDPYNEMGTRRNPEDISWHHERFSGDYHD